MNPLFSIVLVNYNSEKYLEQAIISVLSQDCEDYEFLIVDGGSTDHSMEIIGKYANKLKWYVSEPDKGQSDAFNKAFSYAKGQFFTWINADDIMLPGTLSTVKKFIVTHPREKWIALDSVYIDRNNRIMKCNHGVSYSNRILRHGLVTEVAPSTFFSSDLFEKYGPFRLKCHYVMDTDLWIRFVNAGYRYKRINYFAWAFRVHDASKTSSSIEGSPSPEYLAEIKEMREYNGVKIYKWCYWLQVLKKCILNYPFSFFLTQQYKGKDLKNICHE